MDKTKVQSGKEKKEYNKGTYVIGKIIVNLLLMIVGSIIIAAYLSHVQTKAAEAKQKENNELALTEAITLLTKNSENRFASAPSATETRTPSILPLEVLSETSDSPSSIT